MTNKSFECITHSKQLSIKPIRATFAYKTGPVWIVKTFIGLCRLLPFNFQENSPPFFCTPSRVTDLPSQENHCMQAVCNRWHFSAAEAFVTVNCVTAENCHFFETIYTRHRFINIFQLIRVIVDRWTWGRCVSTIELLLEMWKEEGWWVDLLIV